MKYAINYNINFNIFKNTTKQEDSFNLFRQGDRPKVEE